MPFTAHPREGYLRAFHMLYCERRPLDEVATATGMNATVIERAATGWTHGRDGRIGRAVFIYWLKGARRGDLPCCGGKVLEGGRPLPVTPPPQKEIEKLKELEGLVSQAQKAIDLIRGTWGLASGHVLEHETHAPSDPDTAPYGGVS